MPTQVYLDFTLEVGCIGLEMESRLQTRKGPLFPAALLRDSSTMPNDEPALGLAHPVRQEHSCSSMRL